MVNRLQETDVILANAVQSKSITSVLQKGTPRRCSGWHLDKGLSVLVYAQIAAVFQVVKGIPHISGYQKVEYIVVTACQWASSWAR